MYRRYYLVYLKNQQEIVITSRPEAVAENRGQTGEEIWVGEPSLPHWLAVDLAKAAREILAGRKKSRDLRRPLAAAFRHRLRRQLRLASFTWEQLPSKPTFSPHPFFPLELPTGLAGKILTGREIRRFLRWPKGEEVLAELALRGEIEIMPAVETLGLDRAICHRCGEIVTSRAECWFCGEKDCWICPACQAFGPATGCETLYALPRPPRSTPSSGSFSPAFGFSLTPAQKKAAEALADFLSSSGQEFLLWAVCGAGKTEVVFSALPVALNRGDRILLATPRRDVAGDLAARLKAAFPSLRLAVHYGGRHQEDDSDPDLTVATTHQCLRFYRAFDLVILDEVDAFPYHGNRMLYYAVARAGSLRGRLVYVTATPPENLEKRCRRGDLPYVRLPVRPHGHPLPVPTFIRASLRSDRPEGIPATLAEIITTTVAKGRRLLLFAPTVRTVEEAGRILARWGEERGLKVAWLHAADPQREEKRALFAQGRVVVLVTTTVLERGLTLGPIDVGVLWADYEPVFDAATLIQIAGRAGRLAADPKGAVYFLAERENAAMRAARAAIMAANEEASREGFLNNARSG